MFICKLLNHDSFLSGLRTKARMREAVEQRRRQGILTTAGILLCAGWVPHFRVFVWGCLCLISGLELSAT